MSRIKSGNTKPEMIIRKFLFSKGLRYKLHKKDLYGKPDLVLSKFKIVIFINGCFWHGHEGCKYFVLPKTRTEWWMNKIIETRKRDGIAQMTLANQGWKVITIFECELKAQKETTLQKLYKQITDTDIHE